MRHGEERTRVIDEAARRCVARSARDPTKEEISFFSTVVIMKEEKERSAARDGG